MRAAWAGIGPVRPPRAGWREDRALWALLAIGLILGILWTCVFAGAWRFFGERQGLRLVPALAVLVLDLLVSGRFLLAGVRVVEWLAGPDESRREGHRGGISVVGALAAALLVVGSYAILLALPRGVAWWPSDWRWHLRWVYPRPIFRSLVLMPIWACWSMVLAAGVGGRSKAPAPDPAGTGEAAGRLAGKAGLRHIFGGFLPATCLTAIYCSRDGDLVVGLAVSLVVFVTVYVTAVAAARLCRGQNGTTLLFCGLVGRTAFVLAWLRIGWHVHGW